jgi:hypothetical protein
MSLQAEKKKCCVCGASSTLRCSACAQAGVDLYFCSAEHQKLVRTSEPALRVVGPYGDADKSRLYASLAGLVRPQTFVRPAKS